MINSRLESSTLEVLIREIFEAEREDCYWELNAAAVGEINEEAPDREMWYSPRVRSWVRGLRASGFLIVRETFSDGFFQWAANYDLNAPPESEFRFSQSTAATAYAGARAMEWDALAFPRIEEFISSLPTVDPASIPEEDRSCAICLELIFSHPRETNQLPLTRR